MHDNTHQPAEFRPLPVTLTHDGHTLRQVERNEHAAIYSKSKGGRVRVYEVIRIRRAKASLHPHAGPIPARECYPTSEQWGTWGWTHVSLEHAREAFAGLTAEAIEP